MEAEISYAVFLTFGISFLETKGTLYPLQLFLIKNVKMRYMKLIFKNRNCIQQPVSKFPAAIQ